MLSVYLMMIDNSDDKVKFEKVYKNYKNIMLNRAYEIVKERQLAEDAVHNAFLKIINNLPKIKYNFTYDFVKNIVRERRLRKSGGVQNWAC